MSSGIGRPRLRIWLVALGLGGVVVGGAAGAVPDSAGVIHGCVDRQNRLTVIDTETGQSCDRVASTPLDWNQKGPEGVPGAAGPAGPVGPVGPTGKGIKAVLITAVGPDDPAAATYDPATEQLSLRIPRGHDGANGELADDEPLRREGHDGRPRLRDGRASAVLPGPEPGLQVSAYDRRPQLRSGDRLEGDRGQPLHDPDEPAAGEGLLAGHRRPPRRLRRAASAAGGGAEGRRRPGAPVDDAVTVTRT